MFKLPISEVENITGLREHDIRYVFMQVDAGEDVLLPGISLTEVDDRHLMLLFVYNMLKTLQFEERSVLSAIKPLAVHIKTVGAYCGERINNYTHPDPIKSAAYLLTIADNRFVTLAGPGIKLAVWDFRELAWLERIRAPLVSLALALPELFLRVVSGPARPSGQQQPEVKQ